MIGVAFKALCCQALQMLSQHEKVLSEHLSTSLLLGRHW